MVNAIWPIKLLPSSSLSYNMKIDDKRFCSLATSAKWQTWLYHHNRTLYKRFIDRLSTSSGCSENKRIMSNMLNQIRNTGHEIELLDFLQSEFPAVIIRDGAVHERPSRGSLFSGYQEGILTYPHRKIIKVSSNDDADVVASHFLNDKIFTDFVIINNTIYAEYLFEHERGLINEIPSDNWQVAAWKKAHQK